MDTPQYIRCTVSCSIDEYEQFLCKPSPESGLLILHWPINADASVSKAAATLKSSADVLGMRWEPGELEDNAIKKEKLLHKGEGVFKFTDLVLERPQGIIFHERVAVVLAKNLPTETLIRVKQCLDAGNQRREAQQWVGFGYVGLVVLLVCMVKKKKSSVFVQMLAFSQEAAKWKPITSPAVAALPVSNLQGSSPSSAPGQGLTRSAKNSKGPLKRKK